METQLARRSRLSDERYQSKQPDEQVLIEAAARQMDSFITELGTGAIDSFTLRRSIRHLLEYGQDSELTALLEYVIVQAFKNVTRPTEHQLLKRNLGRASILLETQEMPVVTRSILTRPQMAKIIALFEQLTRTTDLSTQHIILQEIEREHMSRKASTRRDMNILKVLGPNC
jgi:hypothetical protein